MASFMGKKSVESVGNHWNPRSPYPRRQNVSQYVLDRRENPELMDVIDHLRLDRAEEKRERRRQRNLKKN